MKTPRISEKSSNFDFLGRRDAFHVPGILVKSYTTLKAGQLVKFSDENLTEVEPAGEKDYQAIVDPFIRIAHIKELFWVLISPQLVIDLTHNFKLPFGNDYFQDNEKIKKLEKKLEDSDEDNPCKGCYD